MKKYESVEAYIASFEPPVLELLQQVRQAVKEAAPQGIEVISYGMPALKNKKKVLVYYAACKSHLGFYPTSLPMSVFAEKLKQYKTSKGAIQFPYSKPVPLDLIKDIIAFRLKQEEENKPIAP